MSELSFYGKPARVLIEMDLRDGRRGTVDVTPNCNIHSAGPLGGYSNIHIPIRGSIEAKLHGLLDECDFRGIS